MRRFSTDGLLRRLQSLASLLIILGVSALLWPSTLGGQVSYVMVSGTSMQPGMHTGDLVLVRESSEYEVGDTIAFRIPDGEVGAGSNVIHRIVGGDPESGFVTQGDNRQRPDVWRPRVEDIVGERWTLVPGVGSTLHRLRNPLAMALAVGALTLVLVATPTRRAAPAAARSDA